MRKKKLTGIGLGSNETTAPAISVILCKTKRVQIGG